MANELLEKDIQYLKGVGPKRAELYHKLGITLLRDLLTFYPRGYIDYSALTSVRDAPIGETCNIRATVYRKRGEARIRKGLSLFKVFATDGENDLAITIFNNRYAFDALKENEEYIFHGKVGGNLLKKEMISPLFISPEAAGTMEPIYHLSGSLTSKSIAANVRSVFSLLDSPLPDPLPDWVRQRYALCHIDFALRNIHFPTSAEALALSRKRLIFEELLLLQLGLFTLRGRVREEKGYPFKQVDLTGFYKCLPFTLTGAQQRVIGECVADLQGAVPMNRLVQGDVGSGKTMVAAALCSLCRQNGVQAAFMAPTELLAEQHYKTLQKVFGDYLGQIALLTSSTPAAQKRAVKSALQAGEITLVIGTHALIQQDVEFAHLALVITDEQHRFGVAQRAALAEKGENPHVLVMSATPIPRTLALILYGDLDVSVIDELPGGRLPIRTLFITPEKRQRMLGFLKKELDAGRQAYIVCPVIEESETLDLAAASQYAEKLQRGILKQYKIGLLHGKMKPAEKEAMMRAFAQNAIQVLVATTVIEVGIDVPNATIMAIENAERFGLSQLHQLRGRVGRGEHQSFCILISEAGGQETRKRLSTMCKTNDGFLIAREDLKLRGPGDFFGNKQHGLPALKIADMLTDTEMLHPIQDLAHEILEKDPSLSGAENRELQKAVQRLFAKVDDGGL